MAGILQSLSASYGASAGEITVVQSKSGTTADGSAGLTVSFDTPVTAGNAVIAFISAETENGFSVNPTLVGGGAAALSQVVFVAEGGGGLFTNYIYKKTAVTGGETGVTFTWDGAVRANLTIIEVSGLADAVATDTDANTNTSTTASLAGLSGDGLAVVIFGAANAVEPFTEATLTSGWTNIAVEGGAAVYQMSAYRIDGANAVSVDLTVSPWASAGAVFGAA